MAELAILSAAAFVALDQRWKTRRAARETDVARRILRTFLDRGGPIPVADIVAACADTAPEDVERAVVALDEDDLILVREGRIHLAYPFTATPTPFLIRLGSGTRRYACCAVDALGFAPMLGQGIEIRSRCHQSRAPLTFTVRPDGPGVEAQGVMLWIGKRPDDRAKAADAL